ncbi:hypothetical protein HGRIS_002222 [Hohenbuehelia grisea]|uniref:Translation initiation factor eIF2B subunit gamma n=1 Tax=Hohenbuehelia grisea TaxID=104357 RepID=A0ABR3JK22_9AGAR
MDLSAETSNVVIREFLAVVLAGFGNDLVPLTSNDGDEACPKALLPIANKPVIDYTLSWLDKSGIKDVLLICPSSHRAAISHYLHSDSGAPSTSLSIDVQAFDESPESAVGACTLLRQFSSRITTDFVLLPCDFIPPPNLTLCTLLDKFRTDSVADGAIATSCWFTATRPEKGAVPEEWGVLSPPTSIVWDKASNTLLYPRTTMSLSYQDSHVYVCKHSVLDALQQKGHFDSFKEEFLPWLCKVQYQRTKREKYGQVLSTITNNSGSSQSIALRHSTLKAKERNASRPQRKAAQAVDPVQDTTNSPVDSDAEEEEQASLRVGVVVIPSDAGFTARVNTLPAYLEANRHFLSQTSYSLPTDPVNRALIDPKAQISADSMVAASTKVEERTNIKKSVIGKHCVISRNVKVVGCVILDHCIIAEGAKLEGCILGKNTKVGAKAELTRCVTQAGYEVDAGETVKNEKLEISDWTAASQEESTEDGSEGDSEEGSEEDGSEEQSSEED